MNESPDAKLIKLVLSQCLTCVRRIHLLDDERNVLVAVVINIARLTRKKSVILTLIKQRIR